MKMANKKTVIIVCVVAAILLGSLIGYSVYRNQKDKAYLEENYRKLYDAIVYGSAELGITDIDVISIEQAVDGNGKKSWYVSYVNSEQFGQLDNEQMLTYFSHLSVNADSWIAPYIGCTTDAHGEYGGLRILSGGHEYMYRTAGTVWHLYKDGEKVYTKEWGGHSNYDALEEFYKIYGKPAYGDCTICKESANHKFQGSYYCEEHYMDAVNWVFEQALKNSK